MTDPFFTDNPEPFALLQSWLDDVANLNLREPKAMTVSTVNALGEPHARVVLLRGIEAGELYFYTNYDSQKGLDLAENAKVALNFYWDANQRQLRIRGSVRKTSAEQSDQYWQQRRRASQLSQHTSKQSQVVPGDRSYLIDAYAATEKHFTGQEVPRPENWGGYAVKANYFEFWLGHPDRFHDRFVYQWDGSGPWQHLRLYP